MRDVEGNKGAFHPRKRVNRKTKLQLVFDPNARREFLKGFHKRKLQRKKKAQEQLEQQIKEERKRLKQEAKESYKKLVVSHRPIPELEDLLSQNYELENHSVSITELSTSDLAERNNWIGTNKVQYEQEASSKHSDEDSDSENDELPGMELKTKEKVEVKSKKEVELKSKKDVKKIVKKQATKQVQKSKAFKLKNKLERQKNKKESLKKKKKRIKLQSKSRKGGKHGKKRK